MSRVKPARYLGKIHDLSVVRRLLARTVEDKGCWLWDGYCDRKSYGQVWYSGQAHWVHRISFAIFNDEIPEGLTVHHKCGCTNCVNPDHLTLLTVEANAAERFKKTP